MLPTPTHSSDPDEQEPHAFVWESAVEEAGVERPARSGVQVRTTRAEVVERGGRKVLRVGWEVKYTGTRWPLVILEPSLDRETSGQTELLLIARGKSGQAYYWVFRSPQPLGAQYYPTYSRPEWFLEVGKEPGTAGGSIEADLGEAKAAFIKHLPKEFSAEATPEGYIRLEHRPNDRAEYLHLDAWIGYVISPPRAVTIRKW
jgi:hypothetical protein